MLVGYSFLHTIPGPAPDWFVQDLKDYFERFMPAYASRYLNQDLTVEPAGPVADRAVGEEGFLEYFVRARAESTWGYDSLVIMTDAPFRRVSGDNVAGTNYYLAKPNFAWTSVRNWEEVDALSRDPFYQTMPSHERRRYALMYGLPANPGIRGLAVAGHELSHYLLLRKGGPGLSSQIDGGRLSGMAFLDDSLNEVHAPRLSPPNWRYAAQRVCGGLRCQSPLGAYSCGWSPTLGGGNADPDVTIDLPFVGPIDVSEIATWTIIFAVGGLAVAGALRLAGLDGKK